MRKRRTSGRGSVAGVFISVTNVSSAFAWVTGSLSAIKAEDTAQSSQEEQYFSGVCVSLLPDLTSAGVWQGGDTVSDTCTESIVIST